MNLIRYYIFFLAFILLIFFSFLYEYTNLKCFLIEKTISYFLKNINYSIEFDNLLYNPSSDKFFFRSAKIIGREKNILISLHSGSAKINLLDFFKGRISIEEIYLDNIKINDKLILTDIHSDIFFLTRKKNIKLKTVSKMPYFHKDKILKINLNFDLLNKKGSINGLFNWNEKEILLLRSQEFFFNKEQILFKNFSLSKGTELNFSGNLLMNNYISINKINIYYIGQVYLSSLSKNVTNPLLVPIFKKKKSYKIRGKTLFSISNESFSTESIIYSDFIRLGISTFKNHIKINKLLIDTKNKKINILKPLMLVINNNIKVNNNIIINFNKTSLIQIICINRANRDENDIYIFFSRLSLNDISYLMDFDLDLTGIISGKLNLFYQKDKLNSIRIKTYENKAKIHLLNRLSIPLSVLGSFNNDKRNLTENINGYLLINCMSKFCLSSVINDNQFLTKIKIRLAALNDFLSFNNRVDGIININVDNKKLNFQRISGKLLLEDGIYENNHIGVFLEKIKIQANIDNNIINFSHILGNNGSHGSFKGYGTILIVGNSVPEFNLKFILDRISIQTDDVKVISNGSLFLKGKGLQSELSGSLIPSSTIYIIDNTNSKQKSKYHLKNDLAKSKKIKGLVREEYYRFPLNIKITPKNNVLIKGYGLNSKWLSKSFYISGDMYNPYVIGTFKLLDGRFDFFGKQFDLTSGHLSFLKDFPNNPKINIKSARNENQILVYLNINGHSSRPEIEFTSSPALSSEEILCKLLFDKNLDQISVGQGFYIGSILTIIQSQSGVNLLERLRNVFGLDFLEFKTEVINNSYYDYPIPGSLFIGKEILRNLFIRVEQEIGLERGKVEAELRLNPLLSFIANFGILQNREINLGWFMRYY